MRFPRAAFTILVLPALAVGGFVWWSQEKPIAGIEPPVRASFDQALIEQGARLAALGNCAICHTVPGGRAYAGARPIPINAEARSNTADVSAMPVRSFRAAA